MTEADWLACDSFGRTRLTDDLPGMSYRRFSHFLAAVLPLFARGEWCLDCQEGVALLRDEADVIPNTLASHAADRLWSAHYQGVAPAGCGVHYMTESGLACAAGIKTITECWSGVVGDLSGYESPSRRRGSFEEDNVKALALVRDIFGNPFRALAFPDAWRTPAILSMGTAAYEDRDRRSGQLDNARLAVLSDALEEAGFVVEALLSHLRSPGPHVRGCWALDLILGKA